MCATMTYRFLLQELPYPVRLPQQQSYPIQVHLTPAATQETRSTDRSRARSSLSTPELLQSLHVSLDLLLLLRQLFDELRVTEASFNRLEAGYHRIHTAIAQTIQLTFHCYQLSASVDGSKFRWSCGLSLRKILSGSLLEKFDITITKHVFWPASVRCDNFVL